MKIKREINGEVFEFELTWEEQDEFRREWFREQIMYGIEDLRGNDDLDDEEITEEDYANLEADADELANELDDKIYDKYFASGVFSNDVFDFLYKAIEDRR